MTATGINFATFERYLAIVQSYQDRILPVPGGCELWAAAAWDEAVARGLLTEKEAATLRRAEDYLAAHWEAWEDWQRDEDGRRQAAAEFGGEP